MKDKHVKRDSYTYVTVINRLCEDGAVHLLLPFFRKYENELVGDVRIYNEVILALFKANEPDTALEVYNSMISKEIQPSAVTVNILINNLFKVNRFKAAYDCFLELQD